MNTKKDTIEIPAPTNSGRARTNRNGKRAGSTIRAGTTRDAGAAAPRATPAASAFVALAPSFIALAERFGMVPERLAERVIAAFAATRPARITVKRL